VTFSGFGGGAGQMGRQKMPVLVTPVKNSPSNRGSLDNLAFSHILSDSMAYFLFAPL
jgi:hypothetical protein